MSLHGRFFGQYLCDRGVIGRRQLDQALALQQEANAPLGSLAIDLGFLSAEEVARVLAIQQGRDERFGEIALAEGLLAPERLEILLSRQAGTHLFIGEALVRLGVIGYGELERLLAEFNQDNERTAASIRGRLAALRQGDLLELVIWTVQRILARAIASPVKLHAVQTHCGELPAHVLALSFSKTPGTSRLEYGLVLDRRPLLALTYCLLRRESTSDSVISDTLAQFATIVDAAVCRELTRVGHDVAPSCPDVRPMLRLAEDEPRTCVTLSSGLGEVHLFFGAPHR